MSIARLDCFAPKWHATGLYRLAGREQEVPSLAGSFLCVVAVTLIEWMCNPARLEASVLKACLVPLLELVW